MSDPFALGVRYRPSSSSFAWWQNFVLAEVRHDFEHAAALNLKRLTLDLVWADFQRDAQHLNVPVMRTLDQTLDIAAEHDIQIALTLLPFTFGPIATLPPWALDNFSAGGPAVMAGNSITHRLVRHLVLDSALFSAQKTYVREVVRAFAGHPAIAEWIVGDRVATVWDPENVDVASAWLGELIETARKAGADKVAHAVSANGIILSSIGYPELLMSLESTMHVAYDWRPSWARTGEELWAPFLVAYATRLRRQPVVLTDVGFCTSRGTNANSACTNEVDAALQLERVFNLVHEFGGSGCDVAEFIDPGPQLTNSALFKQHFQGATRGLLRADGTRKPAADMCSSVATELRMVHEGPTGFPDPDPALVRRQPQAVARECWEQFIGS